MSSPSGWPFILLLALSQVVTGGKFHFYLSFECPENLHKIRGSMTFYFGPPNIDEKHILLGDGANIPFQDIEDNLIFTKDFVVNLRKKDWMTVDFKSTEKHFLSGNAEPYGIIIMGCTNCGPFVVSSRETHSQFGGCDYLSSISCDFDKHIILRGNETAVEEEDED